MFEPEPIDPSPILITTNRDALFESGLEMWNNHSTENYEKQATISLHYAIIIALEMASSGYSDMTTTVLDDLYSSYFEDVNTDLNSHGEVSDECRDLQNSFNNQAEEFLVWASEITPPTNIRFLTGTRNKLCKYPLDVISDGENWYWEFHLETRDYLSSNDNNPVY